LFVLGRLHEVTPVLTLVLKTSAEDDKVPSKMRSRRHSTLAMPGENQTAQAFILLGTLLQPDPVEFCDAHTASCCSEASLLGRLPGKTTRCSGHIENLG